MYEIVCLLDMLVDFEEYTHLFLNENLDFLLLDVGSIHFDIVFEYLSHGLNYVYVCVFQFS